MKNTIAIKKIETKEDMLMWATAINNNPMSISEKCDFQDIWARSDRKTLDRLFIESNGSRNIIICSVHNTMSYEEVERLLKTWATDKANKIINTELETLTSDHMTKLNEVNRRENAINSCLKGYWKRIADLRRSNSELKRRNDANLTEIDRLRGLLRTANENTRLYKEKADKYDTIKTLLA